MALLYRLQGAEGWLGWRVRELLSKELGALGAGMAGGWRVRLVDGTGIGVAGPGGKALFRLHAAFDLAARRFDALELTGGHRTQTSELLGISRKVLWEKLRDFGIAAPGEHGGDEENS